MSTTQGRLTVGLFAVVLLGFTEPACAQQRDPGRGDVRGIIKAVDVARKTITVTLPAGRDAAPAEKTFALADNVEVCVASSRVPGVFAAVKLADLPVGTPVGLTLRADQKAVEGIAAEEPLVRGILKSIDPNKKTVMLAIQVGREAAVEEKSYVLDADLEIILDDGRGRRVSLREGKIADLNPGAVVMARLSLDRSRIRSVQVEPTTYIGTLKALDAEKRSLTLTMRPARGEDAPEEKTITLAGDSLVLLDDGRGRRLSVREGKLSEVPVGSQILLRLSADKGDVVLLRAEAPGVVGLLKAVDVTRGTITIAIPRGREDPEVKTLSLLRDVVVNLDGKEAKLTDLKPGENGPYLQLRLTLDQQSVQSIIARQPRPRE